MKWSTEEELTFDARRHVWIGETSDRAVDFALEHWIASAIDAIEKRGIFTVALSGGSTPNTLFKRLKDHPDVKRINWKKVLLFWSDERSVPPTSPESNFGQAMSSGMQSFGIPHLQVFRMEADFHIEENAKRYEEVIKAHVPGSSFDLMMLGVGEDGHTASLFPGTKALNESKRLVVANEVPQKETWRMTMTYPLINKAHSIVIYALGERKAPIIEELFKDKVDTYPVWKVGSSQSPALWILDSPAASKLL
jgi:6-phosphogluconolactonase